ncbi:hypothetical protein [Mycobacterium bourgelatii]|nr:hypothetical protein [Mycobacterium bourgelatii]MCV6974465.1 hypothetical protein [Mycobacterium bourgelatii]
MRKSRGGVGCATSLADGDFSKFLVSVGGHQMASSGISPDAPDGGIAA